ncbi:hypothetical protein [Streptomyces flavofungini]|uniref:Transcriptional regulator n=1 Tax=Streptomyces flavofungini TaxID=68200 RepID=A0ABS0XJ73_9ACTN|nr:hypothetical protein [Streptomyces flavofungini]MBJ3813281.1 hypothetical protein [Streptomyces flavofungini]
MASRREKVARWESGRVIPELTAQFAIAHLHGVSQELVLTRQWPDWLYTATGHAALLAPWTAGEAARALTSVGQIPAPPPRQEFLIISGTSSAHEFISSWREVHDHPTPLPLLGSHFIGSEAIEAFQNRHEAIKRTYAQLGAGIARPLADADLATLALLCREARCDGRTAASLYAISGNAAAFCGWLAYEDGDQARAQSCYLAALRAAAAAHDRHLGSYAMILLAKHLNELADPDSAASMLDSARNVLNRAPYNPLLTAVLESSSADVHASLGQATLFDRCTDAAFTACSATPREHDLAFTEWVSMDQIAIMAGAGAATLGQAQRALEWLEPVLCPAGGTSRVPRRETAYHLAPTARAYLELGNFEAIAPCVEDMKIFLAHTPSYGAQRELSKLASALTDHSHIPDVQDYLNEADFLR